VSLLLTQRITTTLENARWLAITKQHLAGKLPDKPDADKILEVFRDLGAVQLDPISAVAPSHLIVLWSRLGNFDRADLEQLLWRDKKLFEYWAHQHSIVLMEDYPLYYSVMQGYPEFATPWGSTVGSPWAQRVNRWLNEHSDLREYVVRELRRKGPLLSRQFEDETRVQSRGSGWGSYGDVSRMLFHLLFKGEVMVVGRQGNQKLWGLTKGFLPRWASKKALTQDEVEHEAVQRAIRALGTANPSEIKYYFLRGRYRNLKTTLKRLLEESKILPVVINGGPVGKGERYIHTEDVPLLNDMGADDWQPRVSLLSPFDNLICDRTRTRFLFKFDYSIEIYTPSHKRRYGYYVLPILYGDRFIGRIDPLMDRKNKTLLVKAVHAEPKAPRGAEVSKEIAKAIENLSQFLGAEQVVYSKQVPGFWRDSLS
jgi:uncharacterized protein